MSRDPPDDPAALRFSTAYYSYFAQRVRLDANLGIFARVISGNRPSVRFFQQQGFRVLPCPWKKPKAAVALIRCVRQDATDKMLGVLFTGWSAGGNGEHLLAAWKDRDGREKPPAKSQETAQGIAAVIKAGLQELDR